MSESETAEVTKAPVHLWVTGVLGFLWSSIGTLDYVMTHTRNESYMSAFSPEQLSFFYSLPSWTIATWAIAVWGGVIGAIFLLLRKGVAVWIFLASLICMLITTFQNYVLSDRKSVV